VNATKLVQISISRKQEEAATNIVQKQWPWSVYGWIISDWALQFLLSYFEYELHKNYTKQADGLYEYPRHMNSVTIWFLQETNWLFWKS
jgi:hypothetical protein